MRITNINSTILNYFNYFYQKLKYRLIICIILSIIVGFLDGLGLTVFLPIIQIVSGNGSMDLDNLGGMKFIIDLIARLGLEINLFNLIVLMVSFFVLKGCMMFIQKYYSTITRQKYIKSLRIELITLLSNIKFEFLMKSESGEIQNTLSSEISRSSVAIQHFITTFQSISMLLVYLSLAFYTNSEFAIMATIGGSGMFFFYNSIFKKTEKESIKITKENHLYHGLLIENISFIKYLKSTGLTKVLRKKLSTVITNIEDSNKKIGFYRSLLAALREPVVIVFIGMVLFIQSIYFDKSIDGVFLSIIFLYRSVNYLTVVNNSWNNFLTNAGAIMNLDKFENELISNQNPENLPAYKKKIERIELNNVGLKLNNKYVLRNISLSIKNNKTVALIGKSGSGKTSIANLISGLIRPSDGIKFPS